jgi:AraC family transcriptional regulator of adaptative response / DNA-3-methyladenine glycosylase II
LPSSEPYTLLEMQPFGAVVTTGIYCQPGCSAQPRADHVRRFTLAAAAEAAGFRACLRCRPYRYPQPIPSTATELVCRAVHLVLDGSLDEGSEADLGRRLGISGRHLRRLFVAQLGVTPDGLARSARAHFARRLLDDTDFTITEIAFAAGFGSLRQFNRVCLDIFRAPPRVLRSKRRRADRLVADGGLILRLPFGGSLDWDAMSAYFAAGAIPGVEHVSSGVYRRSIVVDGHPGVLELARGGEDHLLLRAHLPRWRGLVHLVERARRMASIDVDTDEAVRLLADDPLVGPLVRARPGIHVPGTWDAFETGVRAIIGEHVVDAETNRLMGRLVERTGRPLAGLRQLGLSHTFPSPATLADRDLSVVGLTTVKVASVRAFAAAVAKGELLLDRSVPLGRLVGSIASLPGLGWSTAQYIALRLGEGDALPSADPDLRSALGRQAGSRADIGRLAEAWRPWRALAVTHLWTAQAVSASSVPTAGVA